MQIEGKRVVNLEREHFLLPSSMKIFVVPWFSYIPYQILGKKDEKNAILTDLTLWSSLPLHKHKRIFKILTHGQMSYVIVLE